MIDLRREAARLYRSALSGGMSADNARSLASVLRTIAIFITNGELEQRVRQLEEQADERGARV